MASYWLPLKVVIVLAMAVITDARFTSPKEHTFGHKDRVYYDVMDVMHELQEMKEENFGEDTLKRPTHLRSKAREWNKNEKRQMDTVTCNANDRYRSIDGVCNNLNHPMYGATNVPYKRFIRAKYADNIGAPRAARNGRALPNTRKVSYMLFKDVCKTSKAFSSLAVGWGQFIGHDISKTASSNANCTDKCVEENSDCFGIPIPEGDPFFVDRKVKCITLTRTGSVINEKREQLNSKTSFLDGSPVYGVDQDSQDAVRILEPDQGLMKETVVRPNCTALLPPATYDENCRGYNANKNITCFNSGDGKRVNQNTGLISAQTLMVREHNRIAKSLFKIKGGNWTGNTIYSETRKIVIALIQHITYNEYLPELLSPEWRVSAGLILKNQGFWQSYDDEEDPTAINSFAAAALRLHSQPDNEWKRDLPRHTVSSISLKDHYDNTTPFYNTHLGGVDAIFRGLVAYPAQISDKYFAKGVTNWLSRFAGDLSDLAAIDIQRGRDHGLPSYNEFREACGLRKLTEFDQFDQGEILRELYNETDDVDLYVGVNLERPKADETLGPTYSCLVSQQFGKLRRGDRFWYEREHNVTGFTLEQLTEIRKVSLAGIICQNSDNINEIPRNALSADTATVPCADVREMDLSKW